MTPEQWQQVKDIFQSAIERPPSERDGFISQACADDPDLRSKVQSLISFYDTADDSLQSVAVNVAAQRRSRTITSHRDSARAGWARFILQKILNSTAK